MNIPITDKINYSIAALLGKSDKLGKVLANEAYRAMIQFVPRRTGNLVQNHRIKPWEVEYLSPYASAVYNGSGMNFRQDKNKFASAYWDEAAWAAGQDKKVISAGQRWINKNL